VQQAAKRISDGDYDQPVEFRTRGDELGSLARSMNTMMGELAQYRQNMQSRVDDATARIEEARRHLLMAQQLSATGRVAAGMAHEINNPLSGVLNAVGRLADPKTPADQKSRLENLVRDALLRIQQLVKRILESTPRDDVQLEPIDAAEILHRTIDLAEHRMKSNGIELQVDLQDGLILQGSSHELGQAFLNLVLNACDAMPDGGRLGIGAVAENGEVVIEFSDSGEGISEEERQRVFEMFYTTKSGHGGSGLGLGMVHNIVTGHGGTIAVREAEGGGALFVLRFPEAQGTG
jgi:two-component system NtrC family sensor kinase